MRVRVEVRVRVRVRVYRGFVASISSCSRKKAISVLKLELTRSRVSICWRSALTLELTRSISALNLEITEAVDLFFFREMISRFSGIQDCLQGIQDCHVSCLENFS